MPVTYSFKSLAELADYFAKNGMAKRSGLTTTLNAIQARELQAEAAVFEAVSDMIRNTVIEPPPKEESVNKYLTPWRVERQGNGTLNETILVRSATGWAICVMRESGEKAETIARAIAALEFSFSDPKPDATTKEASIA